MNIYDLESGALDSLPPDVLDDLGGLDVWFADVDANSAGTATDVGDALLTLTEDPDAVTRWVEIGEQLVADQVLSVRAADIAWSGGMDALILTRPDLVDAALDTWEAAIRHAGGPDILRPLDGGPTRPGLIARTWGAETTVGAELHGWTVRQLARLLAVMWLSDGSPDAAVDRLVRIPLAVNLIVTARRLDPRDDNVDQTDLRAVLRQAIREGQETAATGVARFAQQTLRILDAGDPLGNVALAKRAATAAARTAQQGLDQVGRAAINTAKMSSVIVPIALALALGLAIVNASGGSYAVSRR